MAILSKLSPSEFRELESARHLASKQDELSAIVKKLENRSFTIPLVSPAPSSEALQDGEIVFSIAGGRNLRLFTKQAGTVWGADFKKIYEQQAREDWMFDKLKLSEHTIYSTSNQIVLSVSEAGGTIKLDAGGTLGTVIIDTPTIDLTSQGLDIDLIDNSASALSIDVAGNPGMLEFDTRNGVEQFVFRGNFVIFGGTINITGQTVDIDLTDNAATALSFDVAGKAQILNISTLNGAEGVSMSGTLSVTGATTLAGLITTPDAITATSETVAASIATVVTEITTNSDADLDHASLANGTDGQIKIFHINIAGVGDTVDIVPATAFGFTQITFDTDGQGCIMVYEGTTGWSIVGNNGGAIA